MSATGLAPRPARAVTRYSRQSKRCPYGGKKSYRTKRKALRVAEAQRKMNGVSLHAYRCPNCDLWHLTSQEPRKAAA